MNNKVRHTLAIEYYGAKQQIYIFIIKKKVQPRNVYLNLKKSLS